MLPASVEVEELPEGVALLLRRDPTHFRRAGLALVKVGLGVLASDCVLVAVMTAVLPGGLPWEIFLQFALAAALCFGLGGLLIRSAHRGNVTRLVVDALALSVSDRLLWFNRKVVIPRASIRSFIVEPVAGYRDDRAGKGGFLESLCAIRVLLENGKSERFALAYGRDVLSAVAEELARLCAAPGAAEVLGEGPPGRTGPYERIPVRLDRPAGSLVQLEEHADGITLIVPPGDTSPAIGCLIVFAGLVTAVAAVALVITAGRAIAQNNLDLNVFGFFGVFLGGVFVLLLGIDLSRRRAVLAVVGDRLMVMQAGMLTSRRREWDRGELLDVRVAPSGMVADDRPVTQIQVVPREGKPFKLLTGRDEPELDWIVTMLQRSLRVPDEVTEDRPKANEGSQP